MYISLHHLAQRSKARGAGSQPEREIWRGEPSPGAVVGGRRATPDVPVLMWRRCSRLDPAQMWLRGTWSWRRPQWRLRQASFRRGSIWQG